jgi:hypothetical protein
LYIKKQKEKEKAKQKEKKRKELHELAIRKELEDNIISE